MNRNASGRRAENTFVNDEQDNDNERVVVVRMNDAEEEKKEGDGSNHSNENNGSDQVVDEDLGSELSGMSEEVPNEIGSHAESGSFLQTYSRSYKCDELVKRRKQRAQDAPKGFRFASERGQAKKCEKEKLLKDGDASHQDDKKGAAAAGEGQGKGHLK